jgi:hypothetical protein
MAAKLTILTQNSDTTVLSDREVYHLQFSLQAASPGNFWIHPRTLVRLNNEWLMVNLNRNEEH